MKLMTGQPDGLMGVGAKCRMSNRRNMGLLTLAIDTATHLRFATWPLHAYSDNDIGFKNIMICDMGISFLHTIYHTGA